MAPMVFNYEASTVALGVVAVSALAVFAKLFYNLFLHPLRRYPGPLLWRSTRALYMYHHFKGQLPPKILELHDRYGPVVRISPNELAFLDPQAWKDIYGHRIGTNHGANELSKSYRFYRTKGVAPTLIAETRENHSLIRKQLAKGFSDRSMHEQEALIGSYADLLVQRLRENCAEDAGYADDKGATTSRPKALDIKSWYNWTTFDIVGDLAFGESFGCLENTHYHPWVNTIANAVTSGVWLSIIKFLNFDFLISFVRLFMSAQNQNRGFARERMKTRMAVEAQRPDLIQPLLEAKDFKMPLDRLVAHAGLLVIAGSETTATLLSGVTYLLLSNPDAMKKITEEVRSSFTSDSQITLTSVAHLGYMLACLDEALRIYPPVAFGMPREAPDGGVTIAGTFVPEGATVACWQWAMNHSRQNWTEPESFKPERHMDHALFPNDKLDALQPFSVGPRNCIGRNLAYAEMRLILARVLFNFDMELVNPSQNWLDHKSWVLWAKPELMVYLKPVR